MLTDVNKAAAVCSTKMTIPTCALLQDDVNPIFDKMLDPYPYSLQNYKSNELIDKEYDVVILENEYLKLTVIPSLGGRLYSAVDKRNNQEFLYRNEVIRPRMIGTRGAWFSGGIEFNFPISHSPTTMDRVNWRTRTYEDGSAAIIFGNIEQMSYMNWKVELRLYPGKAYIEQNVNLYNPTARENKFYFWTNTAVEYNQDLKLIYPFDWCINFDEKYVKWPYYKDMDCRNPREIPSAYETFGKLTVNNFFGIYNPQSKYGLVHYANRKMLKGAKFFIWGNDQNAESWNKSLTNNDSQYIEIQSGPFETQAVYKFLRPYQQMHWNEYWYPVTGMDGFRHAEKELAVNFEKAGQAVKFDLLAMERLEGCQLVLTVCGNNYVKELDLSPERVAAVTFDINQPFQLHEIMFDVYCGSRHIVQLGKRREISDEYPDTDIYEDSRVGKSEADEQKTLKQAQLKESFGQTAEAFQYYRKNLEENPKCTVSLNRLGNMYLKSMQYEQAAQCFIKVLTYDNRNSQARFYLAVTEKEQGNLQRARRLFTDIAPDAEYYQASIVELLKTDLLLGYFQEAQSLCELLDGAGSYECFLASAAYRKDGLYAAARQYCLAAGSDADEYVLAERRFLEESEDSERQLLSFTEGDEDTLLPLALEYLEIGMRQEAHDILQLTANPSLKTKLALGCITKLDKNSDEAVLSAIQDNSLDYIFLKKEHKLLQALMKVADTDTSGRSDYLLGTYYYAVGRMEDALEQYHRAYDKGLRYTVLLRNMGYIYFNCKQDSSLAEKYFAEDVELNLGKNEDSLVYLDRIYAKSGDLEKRTKLIHYMEQANNKSLVLIPLVSLLKDAGQEGKALELLENEEFENWEGREASGPCYRDFIIHMAKKEMEQNQFEAAKQWMDRVRQYPEKLNYGEGAGMNLSDIYYYNGMVYAGLGDEASAVREFRKGVNELFKEPDRKSEKSRQFSLKCQEELQKRELLS